MLPRSSWETLAGQSPWRKVTLVSPFSAGERSQLTVVSPQFGKSARPLHLTRLPGTSSSTRIRWVGPPKPKLAIEPTFGSALLSEVQKAASPWAVEFAGFVRSVEPK